MQRNPGLLTSPLEQSPGGGDGGGVGLAPSPLRGSALNFVCNPGFRSASLRFTLGYGCATPPGFYLSSKNRGKDQIKWEKRRRRCRVSLAERGRRHPKKRHPPQAEACFPLW